MAESKEELKSLLMNVKEESENLALSSTFKKQRSWHLIHHFMAKKKKSKGEMCVCALSLSRVRPCDPMDCSPPGSSIHGIL